MIPARTWPAFRRWFTGHARARLRQAFGAVRVLGLEPARALAQERPLLVVANHQAWWDPLVALVLSDALGTDGQAMMDARNLRRLPFFRLVGAFGVDLDDPRDGALVLRYAARQLSSPGRLVWVFPQGAERPGGLRPLGFVAGSAVLARLAPQAAVLPVGVRYVFGPREHPDLVVSIGAPVPGAGRGEEQRRAQEAAVEAELDRIDALLAAGGEVAVPALLQRRPDRLGAWAEAALARLAGWWLRG
ncbi:lysophospholipid acyltransferase family protein [Myxococcota bacterium]|nr:lysophospholipid acyltransferase family protein [Myxococcota bacterium]